MWGYWLFIAVEALVMHEFLPIDSLAMSQSVYEGIIFVNVLILIFVILFRYQHDSKFAFLLTGALLLRVFFMVWSEYYSHILLLPNSGVDEHTYYYNAMSNMVKGKEFTGYAQLFAWQANIYGLSKIYGKFINILFSLSAITILRKTLIILDIDQNIRTRTVAFACFLPNFAILSALLLRESVIILLVAVTAYFFVLWWKNNYFRYLILSLAASVFAAWLHSGMIAYTLGIVCIAVASRKSPGGRSYHLAKVITVVLSGLVAVVFLVILMNTNLGLVNYFRGAESFADIVAIADAYEEGGSAYNANIVSNDSVIGFLINTPFRMVYFMFAPVPWDWRSATDAIAFLFSGLFYGYVFFKMIPYAFRKEKYSLISAMFMVSLLWLIIFGWGVSNSGTALRHRDKMVIHFLIMLALQQNELESQKRIISRS